MSFLTMNLLILMRAAWKTNDTFEKSGNCSAGASIPFLYLKVLGASSIHMNCTFCMQLMGAIMVGVTGFIFTHKVQPVMACSST